MKKRVTHPDVGEPPAGTWSNCLVIGQHVYIAGMTARGQEFDGAIAGGDAYGQAVAIFTKIKNLILLHLRHRDTLRDQIFIQHTC